MSRRAEIRRAKREATKLTNQWIKIGVPLREGAQTLAQEMGIKWDTLADDLDYRVEAANFCQHDFLDAEARDRCGYRAVSPIELEAYEKGAFHITRGSFRSALVVADVADVPLSNIFAHMHLSYITPEIEAGGLDASALKPGWIWPLVAR